MFGAEAFIWLEASSMRVLEKIVTSLSKCGISFEYIPTMNFFFKVASLLQMLENVGLFEGFSIQHSLISMVSSSQLIGSLGLQQSFIFCNISLGCFVSENGSFKERISEHVIPNDHTSAQKGHAIFEGNVFILMVFISCAMYFGVPIVNLCNSGLL